MRPIRLQAALVLGALLPGCASAPPEDEAPAAAAAAEGAAAAPEPADPRQAAAPPTPPAPAAAARPSPPTSVRPAFSAGAARRLAELLRERGLGAAVLCLSEVQDATGRTLDTAAVRAELVKTLRGQGFTLVSSEAGIPEGQEEARLLVVTARLYEAGRGGGLQLELHARDPGGDALAAEVTALEPARR